MAQTFKAAAETSAWIWVVGKSQIRYFFENPLFVRISGVFCTTKERRS